MNEIVRVKQSHILSSQQGKFVPRAYEMNKYLYRLFPKIYFIGQENCIFNYANFVMWTLEGMLEAVLITLFAMYVLGTSSISASGYNSDLWLTSLTMYLLSYLDLLQLSSWLLSSYPRIRSFGLFCSSSQFFSYR
jgi:magnesium-transporting ATPase (P-type)